MSQPRHRSFIESVVNVVVGCMVALMAQIIIFPVFGIFIAMGEHLAISAVFTGVSIARSYVLRRCFNRWDGQWH